MAREDIEQRLTEHREPEKQRRHPIRIKLKRFVVALVVAGGVVASAGPAAGAILYDGHAGLGASVYQHNQTDLE